MSTLRLATACIVSWFVGSPAMAADQPPATTRPAPDASPRVVQDAATKTITMTVAGGNLQLRLNYDGRCMLDHVRVRGVEVVAPDTGVCTAIKVGNDWATTRGLAATPGVTVAGDTVTVANVTFASDGVSVRETWTFNCHPDKIDWSIARDYLSAGTLTDSYLPGWDFADSKTWTAGILDTGGVAWAKYIHKNASYGAHAGSVLFWKGDRCLKVTALPAPGRSLASRFSQQPSGPFTFAQSVTDQPLATQHALHRSIGGLDVWAPFNVEAGAAVQAQLTLESPDVDAVRGRGDFKGVDGQAIENLLDTVGRYGVIDQALIGGNGWLTGWICLHEPFFAEIGLAVADPAYTNNLATSLDGWRDHALQPSGQVYSRWHHDTGDNMVPGTYDPKTGYYDCGWGSLLDANPDYVINVAEAFDLNGDLNWLRAHKEPCERSLDYLLARDTRKTGLVEMMTASHTEHKSSDWLDVVWASGENAFVNAALYEALNLWAERETILGDPAKAASYRAAAERLRAAFVRPINQGGFWNADKGWFVYWREADGSVHGDNLVTPVNFAAIAYGLCTPQQRARLLDGIEAKMTRERLFHWPLCFTAFGPDEGGGGAFPGYENGDIFLSWGELGVRSYAGYNPSIAVAYVDRLLKQYGKDGLWFQRYLRKSQRGAGDDILAGNAMTVVGLYRDIYGVRPQWNRLLLDPHLIPRLEGTQLRYPLRGQVYDVLLNAGTSTVVVDAFKATAATPFAVNATPDEA